MNVQPPKCKVHAALLNRPLPPNVIGQPTSKAAGDAARETYAASLLLSRGASNVNLGDAALRMLWPNGQKPSSALDCDVIATFSDGSTALGEGKGAKDVYHAIDQFTFVANELNQKARIPLKLTYGVIVVPPNLPFAYFDGTRWTHSDPSQRETFRERLAAIAEQEPPPSAAYCFLMEEKFRSAAQVPAFIPTSDRYHLYTFARTGQWSAPRPLVFGPTAARVEIVLAMS